MSISAVSQQRAYKRAMALEKAASGLNAPVLNLSKRSTAFAPPIYPESERQGVPLKALLRDRPEYFPFAYDLAVQMERRGNKPLANEIIRQVAGVILSTPTDRFLTPPLTGKYIVGVRTFYLEDQSRNEKDLGHEIDRTRRLLVGVHYPAIQDRAPSYRIEPIDWDGDPRDLEKAGPLCTRSQPGLPPAAGAFPVVIFSHGANAGYTDYQQMVEEVASHGFYVITINHPFSSAYTPFLGHFQDRRIEWDTLEKAEREIAAKAQDMEFVFGALKPKLFNIDPKRVGVFGHSQGGVAAVEACRRNKAFKAGVDIDGPLYDRPFRTHSVSQPFLTIAGGKGCTPYKEGDLGEEAWEAFHAVAPRASKVKIFYADHNDFSLVPLFFHAIGKPYKDCTDKNGLLSTHKITCKNIVDFFSKNL